MDEINLILCSDISTHLLAELEDGQSDGHHEREERQLEGVPGLQSKDTDSQGDEGHGLEQHEYEDRDDDLLELSLTSLADGPSSFLVELNVQAQFVLIEVPGADGDFSVSNRQLEGHVVGLNEVLDGVEEVSGRTASDFVTRTVLCHLHGFRDLEKK